MADLQINGRNVAKVGLLEDVEALDTEDWQAMIAESDGAAPDIRCLEMPVVVDS